MAWIQEQSSFFAPGQPRIIILKARWVIERMFQSYWHWYSCVDHDQSSTWIWHPEQGGSTIMVPLWLRMLRARMILLPMTPWEDPSSTRWLTGIGLPLPAQAVTNTSQVLRFFRLHGPFYYTVRMCSRENLEAWAPVRRMPSCLSWEECPIQPRLTPCGVYRGQPVDRDKTQRTTDSHSFSYSRNVFCLPTRLLDCSNYLISR